MREDLLGHLGQEAVTRLDEDVQGFPAASLFLLAPPGIDVAVEALRDFGRKYRGRATELARFARICRVSRVMQPYLDAIA